MPYVPVLGSIAEVIMKGVMASGGSDAKNIATVFHYRCALIAAPPTKTALETRFDAVVGAAFIAAANVRYTQQSTSVRYIDDATDPAVDFTRTGPGAIATDSLPLDVCVSMLLRTGLRGPSYRGSKRFAGANEIDTTGDVLTGAGLARWQTLQAAVFATLVDALGNNWVPSVFSRAFSVYRTNPTTIIANDVTQVLLNKNPGTMRRRKVTTVR